MKNSSEKSNFDNLYYYNLLDMFTFDFDISQLEDKREPKPIFKKN